MLACTLAISLSFGEEVRIALWSGETFTGELLKADGEGVTVKRVFLMPSGKPASVTTKIKHQDIKLREKIESFDWEYSRKVPELKTAEDHRLIALWALERQRLDIAVYHAKKAVGMAPDNPEVLALMTKFGLTLDNGEWLPTAEVLAKQGKINFGGKIVTTEEAQQLRVQNALKLRTSQLQQELKESLESLPRQEGRLVTLRTDLVMDKEDQARLGKDGQQKELEAKKATESNALAISALNAYRAEAKRAIAEFGYLPEAMAQDRARLEARAAAALTDANVKNEQASAAFTLFTSSVHKIERTSKAVDETIRRVRYLKQSIKLCRAGLGIDDLSAPDKRGPLGITNPGLNGLTYYGVNQSRLIEIKLQGHGQQEKPLWCWAAAVQVAFESYGYSIDQDEIVKKVTGGTANTTGSDQDILTALGARGTDWTLRNGTAVTTTYRPFNAENFSPSEIVKECKTGHPIILLKRNADLTIGHAVTIVGCTVDATGNLVSVRYWEVANATFTDVTAGELMTSLRLVLLLRVVEW